MPRALMADPARARQMLETHFEPVVLTPRQTPAGAAYGLETKLKMLPAAIAGGRKVCSMVGCGGVLVQFDGLARRYAKRA